jgi:hypothetical protein
MRISVGAILASTVISASAADINAPVERTITVKSELRRGSDAEFNCMMSTTIYWTQFSDCISRVVSEETRVNRITDPFRLGLYLSAYLSIENTRSAVLKAMKKESRNDKIFVETERFYYHQQKYLKESLGLSNDDICHALADEQFQKTAGVCLSIKPPP